MMNGQDVNLGGADDSVHDPIRAQEDLANFWVAELRNSPPRVREVVQPVNGHEKSPDRDCSVVCRVGFDERVDRGQISLGALGPVDGHARKRFLTSS